VAQKTAPDQQLCREVRDLGFKVSERGIRTLRELGVVQVLGDRKGGRGRVSRYAPGSAQIAAAVEAAKASPDYREKLYNAVLIAWARQVPVPTEGLRWAFRRHFDHEMRTLRNLVEGKRVDDERVMLDHKADRALAAAMLGLRSSPEDLAALEAATGPMLHETMWKAGNPDALPIPRDGSSLGLILRRPDGTVRVEPLGDKVWEELAFAPQRDHARRAPREELDAARDVLPRMYASIGATATDLVIASNAPGTALQLRQLIGDKWWTYWNSMHSALIDGRR
jgi:hypothetical protein